MTNRSIKKYEMIRNDFIKQIRSGRYVDNDQIPTEKELQEQYNVSRQTIRAAINTLVKEGYLEKHVGRGTFVRQNVIKKEMFNMHSFSDYCYANNLIPSSELHYHELEKPLPVIARMLDISENDYVWHNKRTLSANNRKVIFEDSFMPQSVITDMTEEDAKKAFFKTISKYATLQYSTFEFDAIPANKEIAEKLDLREGDAVLVNTLTVYNEQHVPVELAYSYYRTDRMKLYFSLPIEQL